MWVKHLLKERMLRMPIIEVEAEWGWGHVQSRGKKWAKSGGSSYQK